MKAKEIVEKIIEAYVEDDESTFVINGDEKLAEDIVFEFKKKGVKASYIIDEVEILIEIDPVWPKHFPHDSAASEMLHFLEHMQYKAKYRLLTRILDFPICDEHIEKVDVLKKTFWYEKMPKVKKA